MTENGFQFGMEVPINPYIYIYIYIYIYSNHIIFANSNQLHIIVVNFAATLCNVIFKFVSHSSTALSSV